MTQEAAAERRRADNAEWLRQTNLIMEPARRMVAVTEQRDAALDLLRRLVADYDAAQASESGWWFTLTDAVREARALLSTLDGDAEA